MARQTRMTRGPSPPVTLLPHGLALVEGGDPVATLLHDAVLSVEIVDLGSGARDTIVERPVWTDIEPLAGGDWYIDPFPSHPLVAWDARGQAVALVERTVDPETEHSPPSPPFPCPPVATSLSRMEPNTPMPLASRSEPAVAPTALSRDSANMGNEKTGRLNIYVTRDLWRRVKLAAAALDVSVSEYCGEAIVRRLHTEAGPGQHGVVGATAADTTVERVDPIAAARRFRAAHFGKSRFAVSTAELLREARETDDRVA